MNKFQKLAFSFFIVLFVNSAFARGPQGIGYIKIGMTKEAVQAGGDESFRLHGPLQELSFRNASRKPDPGEEWFTGMAKFALSSDPVEVVVMFKESTLHLVKISIDTVRIKSEIKSDIENSYGPGKIIDSRKDEQCIYNNGNNFTIKSGVVNTEWYDINTEKDTIRTRISEIDYKMCPSLNGGVVNAARPSTSISVERVVKSKPTGLF